jgi:hypothetical protein
MDPLLEHWFFFYCCCARDVFGLWLGCLMQWCEAARLLGTWNLVVCALHGVVGTPFGCFWFMVCCAAGGFICFSPVSAGIDRSVVVCRHGWRFFVVPFVFNLHLVYFWYLLLNSICHILFLLLRRWKPPPPTHTRTHARTRTHTHTHTERERERAG